MKRFFSAALVAVFAFAVAGFVRADDAEVKATLDKAIKALGGEAKLGKIDAYAVKAKGTITFGGNDNDFTSELTAQGLDRYRSEFEGDFGGNKVRGVTVLNGDKGWRKFGDNSMEFDVNAVANEKRTVYLQVIPVTILPLKGKGFKVESAADEKAGDKALSVLKVTASDGKEFTLAFDKDSGLPARMVANVLGFQGQEFLQETTYADYKDFDGIKKATKVESRRDGEPFIKQEIVEFKVLEKVDPRTFAEPQ
jgi:hypothetical protein